MRRAWSILLSILLGAVVVGTGTGYFLHLANKDRQLLALEAEQAKATALRAQQEQQNAIQEANNKLAKANEEVKKAHDVLKSIEEERSLLTIAIPLSEPSSKNTKDWKIAISTNQNISLKFPPDSEIINDSFKSFSVGELPKTNLDVINNNFWFSAQPYSTQTENQLINNVVSSTPITYFLKGKILVGLSGFKKSEDYKEAAYFKVYNNGTTTHLLWLENYKAGQGKYNKAINFEDILGTIDFPKD